MHLILIPHSHCFIPSMPLHRSQTVTNGCTAHCDTMAPGPQFLLFVCVMHVRRPVLASSACRCCINCCLTRGKSIMLAGSLSRQNTSNSFSTATAWVGGEVCWERKGRLQYSGTSLWQTL